jgi:glycosyltransferase involved in cell wall biosynthesis|uniref:Glycosyltransferase 2-like domain-containing protein n=1 Tax=viral metagenome TaxID=1070528 RepID=A0A6C0D2E9_9ZZZZ
MQTSKSCSIIIPTYNRKKFEKLIEYNILCQTYPHILEIVIADDGDDEMLQLNVPYSINYIKCDRMTIGQKRNLLASRCKGVYIAHMDTDDVYLPTYIEHSISILENQKKDAVGTSDMVFIYPDGKTGSMRNPLLSMANEATLVYKKSFWDEKPFAESQSSEAIYFLKGRHWQTGHSDIKKVMICICHSTNTVDKNVWKTCPEVELPYYEKHKEILRDINLL